MLLAASVAVAGGCRPGGGAGGEDPYLAPVAALQHQAYAEAVTGRFVSLADFEPLAISARPGHAQLRHFQVTPEVEGSSVKYVVNITRTGVGAMEATLPPGSALEFRLPGLHDFRAYSLLMMAVYSRQIRDDLKVVLVTNRAAWEVPRVLLKAGWNTVMVDLERLKHLEDFDTRAVRAIRLWFPAARRAVKINVDDVLLIDNRRELTPVPPGVRLRKLGLDYELQLPYRLRPVRIRQCDDGLWRLGEDQAILELATDGALRPPAEGAKPVEDLGAFGRRRLGTIQVLEVNKVRVRIANTWYFPASAGQWESMAVRQVRWEHVFYADGRCVTDVMVNNAAGAPISAVRITLPAAAAWAGRAVASSIHVPEFRRSVGRWTWLTVSESPNKRLHEANYLKPSRLEIRIGRQAACDGDVEADGFDESQACYHLRARAGHCRFLVLPGKEGLAGGVFRVGGRWGGVFTATSEGQALRRLVRLDDGSALFVLEGVVTRPRWVEVTGKVPLIGGD